MSNEEATKLMTLLQQTHPKAPPTIVDKSGRPAVPAPVPLDKPDKSGSPNPLDKKDKNPQPNPAVIPDKSALLWQNATMSDGDTLMIAYQPPKGMPPPFGQPMLAKSDNSNTQFAMLGLWAARRHDVPVENSLVLAERRFRHSQLPGGDWAYHFERDGGKQGDNGKPSMTCVGLLGIALGKGAMAEVSLRGNKKIDPKLAKPIPVDNQIHKGLDALHLDKYTLNSHEFRTGGGLYLLWSVERIGVLYDLNKIGKHDWYQWGLSILLPNQNGNGSWETGSYHGSNAVHDTCFALLFLKRVNLMQDLTDLNLFTAIPDPK